MSTVPVGVHEKAAWWAEKHFAGLELGDKRRNARAIRTATLMAEHPGLSIPRMTSSEYEMKAVYNLFARAEVTPDAVQMTHRDYVRQQMSVAGSTCLLVQDLTTVSFTGREPIVGLGPVGDGLDGQQGYLIHTVLAVRWPRSCASLDGLARRPPVEVVGVADQQFFTRIARPSDEAKNHKKSRLRRPRESERWGFATERMRRVAQGCEWVRVCDAEADIHPFLMQCQEYGYGFVVRAAQNRALAGSQMGYVFDAAAQIESKGQFQLWLRGRASKPSRHVNLNVGSCEITIRAPWRPGGPGEALNCHLVRVWENDPPEGEEGLEWILLTNRSAQTFDEVVEIALMYSTRWIVEEFHKALKTGMGIERLQLETGKALMAAGAMMSLVALRLLNLKENTRRIPDEDAKHCGLTPLELQVLRTKLRRPITTVREVILAVAALGGHKNRKCDGMPGWQSLWHGMTALSHIVEGVMLAQTQLPRFSQ